MWHKDTFQRFETAGRRGTSFSNCERLGVGPHRRETSAPDIKVKVTSL